MKWNTESPPCETPVLLVIYRRPELTARVFAAIREARPRQLWIAADGPKTGSERERKLCQRTRDLVLNSIDWNCDVRTRLQPENRGCKWTVFEAIQWAFAECDRLIVLEDDCVPQLSFFRFCGEMLQRYAEDEQVMQITGSNFLGWRRGEESYFFSRFGPCWGWATWRRAWRHYDLEMTTWPSVRDQGQLNSLCPEPFEKSWRTKIFDEVYQGGHEIWDYQWAYAKLVREGLSITPARHLVTNIGFGPDATHTHAVDDPRGKVPLAELEFPLRHPGKVEAWDEADRGYLQIVVGLPSSRWSAEALRYRLKNMARALRKRLLR